MKKEIQKREIDRIMSGMECRRNFECCNRGTEAPCNGKSLAGGAIVDCSETECEHKDDCTFRMMFGFGHICNCPVRKYIARH